jgi:hypothetical protein
MSTTTTTSTLKHAKDEKKYFSLVGQTIVTK